MLQFVHMLVPHITEVQYLRFAVFQDRHRVHRCFPERSDSILSAYVHALVTCLSQLRRSLVRRAEAFEEGEEPPPRTPGYEASCAATWSIMNFSTV